MLPCKDLYKDIIYIKEEKKMTVYERESKCIQKYTPLRAKKHFYVIIIMLNCIMSHNDPRPGHLDTVSHLDTVRGGPNCIKDIDVNAREQVSCQVEDRILARICGQVPGLIRTA